MRSGARRCVVVAVISVQVAFLGVAGIAREGKEEKKGSPALPVSSDALEMICDSGDPAAHCERFTNPAYVAVLTGAARSTWNPRTVFGLVTAAHTAGEEFKALFLARIFTDLDPSSAAGWANRAALAQAAGSLDEAKWSADPSRNGKTFKPAFLPGSISRRPATLSDWAALVALMGEDIERATGAPQMLYVPDDVTGMLVTPTSPSPGGGPPLPGSARPKNVLFEDLIPNAVVMTGLDPMKYHDLYGNNAGSSLLGIASAALIAAGNARSGRVAPFEGVTGGRTDNITSVPSIFSGGTYNKLTWRDGLSQQVVDTPKSAGEDKAIHLPMPIPWSAGSPWNLTAPVKAIGKMGDDGISPRPRRWSPASSPAAGKNEVALYFRHPRTGQYLIGLAVKEIPSSDRLQIVKVARFRRRFVETEGTFAERSKRGVTVLDEAFLAREKEESAKWRAEFDEQAARRQAAAPAAPQPVPAPSAFVEPPTVTLIETLLTKHDIQELAPEVAPLWPDLTAPAKWYAEQAIAVEFGVAHVTDGYINRGSVRPLPSDRGGPGGAAARQFQYPLGLLLVDGERMFTYELTPTLWVTPAPRKR